MASEESVFQAVVERSIWLVNSPNLIRMKEKQSFQTVKSISGKYL